MPSRKRGRKALKPPTDPQPSPSKTSNAIAPAGADGEALLQEVASGADLERELGQLTLQARLDVTQAQIAVSDLARKGHNYQSSAVSHNARAHFGDVYNLSQSSGGAQDKSERLDLMAALSFDGMSDRLMSITPAYAETCRWILHQPEYLRWQDPSERASHHGVLWIKGKAGTGKSTLMSCLYDHGQSLDRNETVVSFFFNAQSLDHLVKSSKGMYRSLLHQILRCLPHLKETLSHLEYPRSTEDNWPIELLENAFRIVILGLSEHERVTCFVDALDECQSEDVRRAIERFEELSELVTLKNTQFRVCFSSRYYPHITMRHHEEVRLDLQTQHMQDISRYIDNKLMVPERTKSELSVSIYRRCAGIFLWVVLVVKQLRAKSDSGSTRAELRSTLDSIPQELEELIANIVAEPDKALISIVQWKLFSLFLLHELKIQELYFAVQTSTGGTTTGYWDPDEIDEDGMVRYLLNASRGLLEYRSESFHFIHESVREYFTCGNVMYGKSAAGHAQIAECCLAYIKLAADQPAFSELCQPVRSWKFRTVRAKLPLMEYATENALQHAEIAFAGGMIELGVLDRFPLQPTVTFLNQISLKTNFGRSQLPSSLLYLLMSQRCDQLTKALLLQASSSSCTRAGCSNSDTLWSTRLVKSGLAVASWRFSPIRLVIEGYRANREEFLRLLLENGVDINMDVNMEAGRQRRLICCAIPGGRDLVELLFRHGARINTTETGDILHLAVKKAELATVQFLLDTAVDVNGVDDSSQTALHLITERTHYDGNSITVADMLLKAGANMEAPGKDGMTVLANAAYCWRDDLVKFLLERGANVHARDNRQSTVLHATLSKVFPNLHWPQREVFTVVQTLLDAGADINADGGSCGTALIAACMAARTHGTLELVRFLIDRGAVFTHQDGVYDDRVAEILLKASQHDGKPTCDSEPICNSRPGSSTPDPPVQNDTRA